jgi:hypothetical protein
MARLLASALDMSNLIGIGAFFLLSLAFWVAGKRPLVFAAVFVVLLIGVVFLMRRAGADLFSADLVLTVGGLVFYFFGLLIVRIVIERSVSVKLLRHPEATTRAAQMKSSIDKRVSDITRHKLGVENGETIRLTALGRFMAAATDLCYSLLKEKR